MYFSSSKSFVVFNHMSHIKTLELSLLESEALTHLFDLRLKEYTQELKAFFILIKVLSGNVESRLTKRFLSDSNIDAMEGLTKEL